MTIQQSYLDDMITPIFILQNDKCLIVRLNKIHFSLCNIQEWNTVNCAKHKVFFYALRFYFFNNCKTKLNIGVSVIVIDKNDGGSLSVSFRHLVEPGEDDGSEERRGQSAHRRNRSSIQTEQSQASSLSLFFMVVHILLRIWIGYNETSFPSGDPCQRFWKGDR